MAISRPALHPAAVLALMLLAVHWLPPPPALAATAPRNTVRLCGSRLANALALLCAGRGFHTVISKRTRSPFVSKRVASEYLRAASKSKRASGGNGIVQECCRNHCSLSTLESYCARSDSDTPITNPLFAQLYPEIFSGDVEIDEVSPTISAVVIPQLTNGRDNEVGSSKDAKAYPAVPLTMGKSETNAAQEAEAQDEHQGVLGSFTYSRERPFRYLWASGYHGTGPSGENMDE